MDDENNNLSSTSTSDIGKGENIVYKNNEQSFQNQPFQEQFSQPPLPPNSEIQSQPKIYTQEVIQNQTNSTIKHKKFSLEENLVLNIGIILLVVSLVTLIMTLVF